MNCHELFVWQKCCFCNLDYGRSLKRFHVSWSCMTSSNMKFHFFLFLVLTLNNPNASTNIFFRIIYLLYYICIINSSIFMLIHFMWRKRHLCNMFEFFLWNILAKNKRQPIKFSAWAAFYLSLWDMYWMKYTRTNIVSWSHKNAFWQEMKRNQKLGKKG